jgi:hypothetical protein
MKTEHLLSIIRHTLTFVGALLITKGYIDEQQLSEITGAVISLVSIIWSIKDKK